MTGRLSSYDLGKPASAKMALPSYVGYTIMLRNSKQQVTIEEITSVYLKHIAEYRNQADHIGFLGYSFGGILATEAARMLVNRKNQVDLLALIDPTVIGPEWQHLSPWDGFVSLLAGEDASKGDRSLFSDDSEIRFASFTKIINAKNKHSKKIYNIGQVKALYGAYSRLSGAVASYKQLEYFDKAILYLAKPPKETGSVDEAGSVDKVAKFSKNLEKLQNTRIQRRPHL